MSALILPKQAAQAYYATRRERVQGAASMRADRIRAEVGRRAEREAAEVGQCGGCSRPPSACRCGGPGGGAGGGNGTIPPNIITPAPYPYVPAANLFPGSFRDSTGQLMPSAYDWYTAAMNEVGGYPCMPYENPDDDCLWMVPVTTGDPQSVAAGNTATLTWSPSRGFVDAYYIDIVALDPATGLSVDPASWRITPPRVADCPQPQGSTAVRGTFYTGAPNCCCGKRFRALIGRTNDGEQMTATFTNDGIGAVTVQAIVRGYEHARRLCFT